MENGKNEKSILRRFKMTPRKFWMFTFFWRSFSLQTASKNFWHIFSSHCKYVKCSSRSDVFIARWFVTVRRIQSNLRVSNRGKWKKTKNPFWDGSKWHSEIFENSHFSAKFFTSKSPKKFLTHFLVTLWVCKMLH